LGNKVSFRLHLGFKRSDFLEAKYIEIPTHALQTMYLGWSSTNHQG